MFHGGIVAQAAGSRHARSLRRQRTAKTGSTERSRTVRPWSGGFTPCIYDRFSVHVLDRLMAATAALDEAFAAESRALLEAAAQEAYRQYLARLYGFVTPLEHALANHPELRTVVDTRRFDKHELLRRDLEALNTRADELQLCSAIPVFNDVQTALGWAYITERGSLGHTTLFHSLATLLPREAAFAASYLKCYFGAIGETWRGFVEGLEAAGKLEHDAARIVAAAQDATAQYVAWSRLTTVSFEARASMRLVR
jgi:heme oxygenase